MERETTGGPVEELWGGIDGGGGREGWMTEAEIRDIINNKLNNITSPIKIIFSDSVCLDCGEQGDIR